MAEAQGSSRRELILVLRATRRALSKGDRATARRLARHAVRLAPEDERTWLYLAAASAPRPGLAYIARALEINPKNSNARRAIRWLVRQLPARVGSEPAQRAQMPETMDLRVAPLEFLGRPTWLTPGVLTAGLAIMIGMVVWLGNQPADAGNPRLASAPVAKASRTPTATYTPSPSPTPTATPTPIPTETQPPTATPTSLPNVSWEYSTDPMDLAHEGRWINVDLTEQRVTAYDGASPIRSFVVSTGTSRYPTVTGQFRVYVKYPASDMSGPGYYLPGVPYTMYFYKGYALHGTYWHDNFGTPMSHGCVNFRTPDAEWLFDFASLGTLVNVHP